MYSATQCDMLIISQSVTSSCFTLVIYYILTDLLFGTWHVLKSGRMGYKSQTGPKEGNEDSISIKHTQKNNN